jgi:hypothetical protein
LFDCHPVYASLGLFVRYGGNESTVLKERVRLVTFIDSLPASDTFFGFDWSTMELFLSLYRDCAINELTFTNKQTISMNGLDIQYKYFGNVNDSTFLRYSKVLCKYLHFVAKLMVYYGDTSGSAVFYQRIFAESWVRLKDWLRTPLPLVAEQRRAHLAQLILCLLALPPESQQPLAPIPLPTDGSLLLCVDLYPPFMLFVQYSCINDKEGHLKSPDVLQAMNAALTFMHRIILGWCLHHGVVDDTSPVVVQLNDFRRPSNMFHWLNGCSALIKKSKSPLYRPQEIQVPNGQRKHEVVLWNQSLFSFSNVNHQVAYAVDCLHVLLFNVLPSYPQLRMQIKLIDMLGDHPAGLTDSYNSYRLHPNVSNQLAMVETAQIELYTLWFANADAFNEKVHVLNRLFLALIVLTSGGPSRLNELKNIYFRKPKLLRNVDRNVFWNKQRFLMVCVEHKTDRMLQRKFNTYKYLLHSLSIPLAVFTLIVRRFYDFLRYDLRDSNGAVLSASQREAIELERCRLFLNTENKFHDEFQRGTTYIFGGDYAMKVNNDENN